MTIQSATVVKTHIDKLKLAKYNPRKDLKPSDKEYQKLKASIEEFGYVLFIVVNKDLTVIGGHQRIKVMKELGYTDIEVTQVDLDKTREKALNLALNKIDGIWDMDMLSDIIRDVSNSDFNMVATGFDIGEIVDITAKMEDVADVVISPDTLPDSSVGGKEVKSVSDVNPNDEWEGMPDYQHGDETGVRDIIVHFASDADVQEFARVVGQKISDKTKFIWFPPQTDDSHLGVYYEHESEDDEDTIDE